MRELYRPWLTAPTDRGWPKDFSLENGNYQNICCECGAFFYGHKRRVVCRKCSNRKRRRRWMFWRGR